MAINKIVKNSITGDAIDATKLADDAVSEEHLDNTAITGNTLLNEPRADGDQVLIYDTSANVFKKINASNLVPISIGNSDEMLVGDLAVAIGHPLTLGAAPTVTTGIVSALERRLDVGGDVMGSEVTLFGLIQTDAPITRGSSGGALINKNGELIGITTAIATADVGAEGLGFAVPINLALNIAEDILLDGKVLHAFLGILGAQHFETAEDGARIFSGVYIQELYGPGGEVFAIGKAGALPGDIIKKINGESIQTLDGLITILRTKRAGEEVEIEILRDSQSIKLIFELDLRPSDV